MKNEELIPLEDFCHYYNVEIAFVQSLKDSGLISITSSERSLYIELDEMPQLEKLVRLHNDLEINLPGIETICHLLEKVEKLQHEILQLKNKSAKHAAQSF